ncbi:MAG: pyridoxal 5'-phosphate synthase glutaminase subunit PdxT [Chloroflexi bacterium]|nr:pyridoxal 5'-phosphate synthase glutaminase subunit PdxT [Chloroflexota bacterium]
MRIGVLALQGDFAEHQVMLEGLGVTVTQVRLPEQLEGLDGLIIPGGESTTIGKLAIAFGLMEPLKQFAQTRAVWGTCAGAILLAKSAHRPQPLLEVMDMVIERNAFGRQVDSFEVDLDIPFLYRENNIQPFRAVFIRAPLIESIGKGVENLTSLSDGRIVAARQGKILATSFHPELTFDDRFHRYFLELVK